MSKKKIFLCAISFMLFLSTTETVIASDASDIRTDELTFIYPDFAGARASGSAGALAPVEDDLFSVIYNPAALAIVARTELTGSLAYRNWNNHTKFNDSDTNVSGYRTVLTSGGAVVPIPVYRGSFTIGTGYFTRNIFSRDFFYKGTDIFDPDRSVIEESILEDGKLVTFSSGFGIAVSPSITLGASMNLWSGNYIENYMQISTPSTDVSGLDSVRIVQYLDTQFEGLNLTMGACAVGRNGLKFGVSLDTPFKLNRNGTFSSDTTWFSNGAMNDSVSVFLAEDNFNIPFNLRIGIAFPIERATFAFAASYSDFSKVDSEERFPVVSYDPRHPNYGERLTASFGSEYILDILPLVLRGGVKWNSDVFNGIDKTNGSFDFRFGAELILQSSMSIDLAAGYRIEEKNQEELAFESSEELFEFLLTTSFRF